MTSDEKVMCFNSIVGFVSDLNEDFGASQAPIKLLFKNISQTTFTQTKKIEAFNELFSAFCKANKEAILARNIGGAKSQVISFSEKAYIDLEVVFKSSTSVQAFHIWAHLLTILAIVDPAARKECSSLLSEERVKEVEKQEVAVMPDFTGLLSGLMAGNNSAGQDFDMSSFGEGNDIIGNIIRQIEGEVKNSETSNPVELIGKIMNSGTFANIVSDLSAGVESGKIDLSKLAAGASSMAKHTT